MIDNATSFLPVLIESKSKNYPTNKENEEGEKWRGYKKQ